MAASSPVRSGWFSRALVALGLFMPALSLAAPAGAIEYTQGTATVQTASQTRIAGAGAPVNAGDTITTAPGSYTIVKLTDGTRMTIRPDSKLVVAAYDYTPSPAGQSTGSMVFNLLRGGLRAVTGLIPKGSSNAARIVTPTATVGIRGTDFDARLCSQGECPSEAANVPGHAPRPNNIVASARVFQEQGVVTAVDGQGKRRLMATGAPLYAGDTIETANASYAVLVFRDETRVTVQPATRMKVDDFVFDAKQPAEGRFLISLLKGGLRAFTGIIGHTDHDHVAVQTPTATVGIRGTGWDMVCNDPCGSGNSGSRNPNDNNNAGAGFTATVWDGSIVLKDPGTGQEILVLLQGETGVVGPGGTGTKTNTPLQFSTPRPDQLQVDMALLFGLEDLAADADGLWVVVRDGHVSLDTPSGELDLGEGETGYTDGTRLIRPLIVPEFLLYDLTPLPNTRPGFDLMTLIVNQGVQAQCTR